MKHAPVLFLPYGTAHTHTRHTLVSPSQSRRTLARGRWRSAGRSRASRRGTKIRKISTDETGGKSPKNWRQKRDFPVPRTVADPPPVASPALAVVVTAACPRRRRLCNRLWPRASPCNGHVNFVKHLSNIPGIIGSYVFNVNPTKRFLCLCVECAAPFAGKWKAKIQIFEENQSELKKYFDVSGRIDLWTTAILPLNVPHLEVLCRLVPRNLFAKQVPSSSWSLLWW